MSTFEQYISSPKVLLGVLAIASAMLVAGLLMPILTISQFYLIDNSFSVVSGVWELFQEGQWLVGVIVLLFSLLLPAVKIIFLARLLMVLSNCDQSVRPEVKKMLRLMHDYGRWAMLDVLVVAVLIVAVKLGALVDVSVHSGLYIFAVSVLLIMYITHRVAVISND